jgi:SAM-dependent methyltransferase
MLRILMRLNRFYAKKRLPHYLKGNGIEIGALHNPLRLNKKKVRVMYVDRIQTESLVELNPEINSTKIISPDIVADAEDLGVLSDESLDFVIARHVLEHIPNPIKALKEFYRVLKNHAILFISLPDKRYSFDHERPITRLEHIIEDYKNSAKTNDCEDHFKEWLEFVELKKDQPVALTLEEIKKHTIHFHVWDPDAMIEIFNFLNEQFNINLTLKDYYYQIGDYNIIFIFEKISEQKVKEKISLPLKETNFLLKLFKK